jgi:hypothetical protein
MRGHTLNAAAKLATFAAVLGITFGAAMAVGAAVGPIDVEDESHDAHEPAVPDAGLPRGLAVAQAGYRFVVEHDQLVAGTSNSFTFRIVDEAGDTITDFDELHERRLHLVVVSRDLVGYHHVHPTMDSSGDWSIDLPPLAAGSYRAFADFQPHGGANLTLGIDLFVPGPPAHTEMPAPAQLSTVDGYTVTVDGEPAQGDTELVFTVARNGTRVATEPYLGAAGHLVAIRSGDLAYLHVHPHDETTAPEVAFTAEFPSAGTYRLFLDFAHDGQVHTASFTMSVPDGAAMAHRTVTATHGEDH